MNIHQRIAELTDLAKIYAEDGAFHTAANRFRQLADEIDAHISAITGQRVTNPHDRYSKPGKLESYIKFTDGTEITGDEADEYIEAGERKR